MVLGLIALVFCALVLVFLVECEKFWWSTIFMIVSLIATQYFLFDMLTWLKGNYLLFSAYVAIYLAIGVAWSFIKWLLFLFQFRMKRQEVDLSIKLHNRYYKGTPLHKTPKAFNYKIKIVAWMSWWPASMIGTLVNDPVRRFLNLVYTYLSSLYQKMADRIVPEIEDPEVTNPGTPNSKMPPGFRRV